MLGRTAGGRTPKAPFVSVVDDDKFNKVESVQVDQSVFGRMFDFGTVTILGTGEGIEALSTIAGPIRLRNSIVVGT